MDKKIWLAFLFSTVLSAAVDAARVREGAVVLLPLECSELLPDNGPFLRYFESVGRGSLRKDKNLAKRIFRVLAMREKIQKSAEQLRDQNPIDLLIRKTLCFYREKKEPLKVVPYDDVQFLAFLHASLVDLEKQVENTVLDREIDKQQRKEYEKLLNQSKELEEKIRGEAEVEADRNYDRLSKVARRKALR